jgi:HSP20 family protein
MTLIQWQPFRAMENWQREMNHLFDHLGSTTSTDNGRTYIPPAEMIETPETIHLRVELPGLEPQDLDIQVSADAVSLSGERKAVSRTDAEGKKRSEFHYGVFRRIIPLPTRIQNTEVKAEYRNGILQLNLPKAESEKTKVVKVNIS